MIVRLALAGALLPGTFGAGAFLRVSPSAAKPGSVVVFTGSVAKGCAVGDQVTLISRLFPGHAFGGEGAVSTRVGTHGGFTRRFSIRAGTARRTYIVTARCGGANLGVEARLRGRE
jgi:hypothetical protein